MANIEFISYDGKYPNLCSTLVIQVDDKVYNLKGVLISGGRICHGKNWHMWAEKGDWRIDLDSYPELKPYKEEITDLVNENIRQGCCGGCI